MTADHGNDPTTPSTDHSREYVPLLVAGRARPRRASISGTRPTFADLGQTLAEMFGVGRAAHGTSFLTSSWQIDVDATDPRAARTARARDPRAAGGEERGHARPAAAGARRRVRPAFQRDRDRIIHCKAFRRLKHKTQVFFAPTGDHYRTRLTHTLEVSQIARTIAKVLRLHEELTEAIALGHDLGHTPFGHAGERVLDELVPGGFRHYEQSLRIVDVLENDGHGLNLTWEVRDGIARHSKGKTGAPVGCRPAQARGHARRADHARRRHHRVRQPRHRRCDARRAAAARRPAARAPSRCSGAPSSARIGRMVKTSCTETLAGGLTEIRMSAAVLEATLALRSFLFDAVYENEVATAEFKKADRHPRRTVEERPRTAGRVPRRAHDRAEGLDPRPGTSWPA